jgi:hypothetical protein
VTNAAPFYRYDPHLGNLRDRYLRADAVYPSAHRPELPARFVAHVEGETIINTMWGERPVAWHAEPGTPCIILGYWSDGTVHLRWAAIGGAYRIDGRFPEWVVVQDPDAHMAEGGRILDANSPALKRVRRLPPKLVIAAFGVLVLLVVLALVLHFAQ